MLHPSQPPTETYTIATLESKTNAELKTICDDLSVTYGASDVKDKLVALIAKKKGLKYTEANLSSKTLANLKAICDGLGLTYEADDTEEELKALILA